MRIKSTALLAAATLSLGLLTACGTDPVEGSGSGSGGGGGGQEVSIVGFSVLEAANEEVFAAFQETDAGQDVEFTTSYGASGDQSRAVESGLEADEVHFSLEPDIQRLVDAGVVGEDWNAGDNKGVLTQSVVVFVVRKGNPEGIETWEDLAKPGVEVVTPNPGSSGSAKWNLLAAYGAARETGGGDAAAEDYAAKLIGNVAALPGSARDASTAFSSGTGDVLLSYENEAILARQNGEDYDYIVPDQTLLIENTGALTTDASDAAQAFYDFQISEEGQRIYASDGFRPLQEDLEVDEVEGANDPANPFPAPETLLTVGDDFGGWSEADATFFDDQDGLFTRLIAEAGKA